MRMGRMEYKPLKTKSDRPLRYERNSSIGKKYFPLRKDEQLIGSENIFIFPKYFSDCQNLAVG